MWDDDDQDSGGPGDGLPDPGDAAHNLWSWVVWTEPDEIEVDDQE